MKQYFTTLTFVFIAMIGFSQTAFKSNVFSLGNKAPKVTETTNSAEMNALVSENNSTRSEVNFITLEIEKPQASKGKIINMEGKTVLSFNTNPDQKTLAIEQLPSGYYFVQLVNESNEISIQKLNIQ